MGDPANKNMAPWWMAAIILLAMSPAMLLPFVGEAPAEGTARALSLFYPAYVIAAGLCAWLAYPKRHAVSWIIIALMLMSHAAMYVLRINPA